MSFDLKQKNRFFTINRQLRFCFFNSLRSAMFENNSIPSVQHKAKERPTIKYLPTVRNDSQPSVHASGDCKNKEKTKTFEKSEEISVNGKKTSPPLIERAAGTDDGKIENNRPKFTSDLSCGDKATVVASEKVATNRPESQNNAEDSNVSLGNKMKKSDDDRTSAIVDQLPPLFSPAAALVGKSKPPHYCALTSGYVSDKSVSESNDVTDFSRFHTMLRVSKVTPSRSKKFTRTKSLFNDEFSPSSKKVRDQSDSSSTLSDGSPTPTRKPSPKLKKQSPLDSTPTNSVNSTVGLKSKKESSSKEKNNNIRAKAETIPKGKTAERSSRKFR